MVNVARVTLGKWHPSFREIEDTNLIHFLAENGHWSPFAHPHLSFRIKAPIFVARQLAKTQVGMVWNEVSRRYVDETPEFYRPELRRRAKGVKQGSLDEVVDIPTDQVFFSTDHALKTYNALLLNDVAPEVARSVLPQSMMTEWIWTGSLYGFARVCQLRLDSHAQKESREIAKGILSVLKKDYPVSTHALLPKYTEE